MELFPHQGVDQIRFGASAAQACEMLGEPTRRLVHQRKQYHISLIYPQLWLTLSPEDQLNFIAVWSGIQRVTLWGSFPFEIAVREIAPWLRGLGHQPVTEVNSFREELNVPEKGVSFIFLHDETEALEAIQLYPRE